MAGGEELGAGGRAFRRLGRGIVRRPWLPIVFWVALLALALPLFGRLNDATQNSAANVSSSAPSAEAAAELARLFPNSSSPTASYLLLTGTNFTQPEGENATLAVAAAVRTDARLTDVASVSTLFSAYQSYLVAQARIALPFLDPSGPNASTETASVASYLWGPAASFYSNWTRLLSENPGAAPASLDYPALEAATGDNVSEAGPVLSAFYGGVAGDLGGFNSTAALGGTGDCPSAPSGALACADATLRATAGAIAGQLDVPPTQSPAFVSGALAALGIENWSDAAALRNATDLSVALESGLPVGWIGALARAFPGAPPSSLAVVEWAGGVADGPVRAYPLPIPVSVSRPFLAPGDQAALVIVAYSVADSTTTSGGGQPVFADVTEINSVVPGALVASAPDGGLSVVQTGPAPLDQDESTVLSQNLAVVLPLTIGILFLITLLYFRAPLAPALTFAGLGISIGLGLAGLVLLATIFGKVDPTALTLENTFVLGVGTDYSIFLAARYREELRKGVPSNEAVVTSVTWAGQSVATSGGTAILATLALAFSGVGLLSQWGETLSLAVLITVLVSLTLVPALLTLVGPRTFWPEVGERAARRRAEEQRRATEERGYFYRAGRRVQRQPGLLIVLILAVSVPLGYLALASPLGYDFYQQLPGGAPATDGLSSYESHFGTGAAFPTQVLVTFRGPLLVGGLPNATEFRDLANVTALIAGTSGVAQVVSPIGEYGAPLSTWLNATEAGPGQQADLALALEPYLGSDGRTVLLTVVTSSSGLSAAAVGTLHAMESSLGSYDRGHPDITSVGYGGGASVTSDLSAQTEAATERMILAVSIGLVIVLFVALRSWVIPPLAVGTIFLSIGWAWGSTQLVFAYAFGLSLYFFVPTVMFILILGLGIDYNIFLLTRVREERLRGRSSKEAVREAVARTGGIITAAAVILAGAFASLTAGDFLLLRAIGFSVAAAVILDAMVVRTYLVPSALHLLGDRVWPRSRTPEAEPGPSP